MMVLVFGDHTTADRGSALAAALRGRFIDRGRAVGADLEAVARYAVIEPAAVIAVNGDGAVHLRVVGGEEILDETRVRQLLTAVASLPPCPAPAARSK